MCLSSSSHLSRTQDTCLARRVRITYRASVDPLTHIVVGRAVVAAADRDGAPARGVAWAAVLGALSPDIDSIVALRGWDRYVRIHEAGTHSVAGTVVLAAVTAAVV